MSNKDHPWDTEFDSNKYTHANYGNPQTADILVCRTLADFFKSVRTKLLATNQYRDPLQKDQVPDPSKREIRLIGVGMGVNPYEILAALTTAEKITAFEYSKKNRDFLRYVQENINQNPELFRHFQQWWDILSEIDPSLYPPDYDWITALKNVQIMQGDIFDKKQCRALAGQYDIATQLFTLCSATNDPREYRKSVKHFKGFVGNHGHYYSALMNRSDEYTTTYDPNNPSSHKFPAIGYGAIKFLETSSKIGAPPRSIALVPANVHIDLGTEDSFYLETNVLNEAMEELHKELMEDPTYQELFRQEFPGYNSPREALEAKRLYPTAVLKTTDVLKTAAEKTKAFLGSFKALNSRDPKTRDDDTRS